MPYNMAYDHDNIAQNHSSPDVVFMAYTDKPIQEKTFTKDEYDEALQYRNSIFHQVKSSGTSRGGDDGGDKRKGRLQVLNKAELHDFIEKHKTSTENVRVSLGKISSEAQQRIKEKTGVIVDRVILDSDSIRHAYSKAAHNLEPNDLDDMFDIINTTNDISVSPEKNPHGNSIIIFKKQEPNGVILCEEYRAGKKELELQTAYRIKKNRQPHGASNQPPANVRNATAPTATIAQPVEKSSKQDGGYPEKNYPQYKGKGQEAVDFIAKQKSGQVRGAFHRSEIGDIDVVWGAVTDAEKHTGYGLAHIIDKHGMEAVKKIGEVVEKGTIKIQENGIATIFYRDFKLGLSKGWYGKGNNHWILTAYKIDKDTGKTFDAAGQSSKAALSEIPKKEESAKFMYPSTNNTEGIQSATSKKRIPQVDKKSSNRGDETKTAFRFQKGVRYFFIMKSKSAILDSFLAKRA